MNLHQLRVFCSVVEERSFRHAAEKLFLSQPSVSQHIASLEKSNNIRLFERKGRSISLTPEGRTLYVLASDLLRQADEIPARFREMQSLQSGKLEAGVSPFAGYFVLPPALSAFRSDFPSISVSIKSGNTTEILSDLRNGDVELIVLGRNFSSLRDPALTYRTLGEDSLVLVAPPSHKWAQRGEASTPETEEQTLIRFAGDCPLRTYVDEFLLRNRIRFGGFLETDEIEMAKHFVLQGTGVAVTSALSVRREIASGELVPVLLEGMEHLSWEIQCVYSSARGLSYPGWEMVKRLEENARKLLN